MRCDFDESYQDSNSGKRCLANISSSSSIIPIIITRSSKQLCHKVSMEPHLLCSAAKNHWPNTAQSQILRMLYFTFVYPELLYCVEIYANTCKSHIEKLIVLNNKLLRVAQNCPIRTHIVDLYKRYSTLPLPLLHEYKVLCFVINIFIIDLLYQMFLMIIFSLIMPSMFMVLGLTTDYIFTPSIHRLV